MKRKKRYKPKLKAKRVLKPRQVDGRFDPTGKATCSYCFRVLSPYMYLYSKECYLFFKCMCLRIVRVLFPPPRIERVP